MPEPPGSPLGGELRATTRLAAPIVLATAGHQLLSVVDVIIAGRIGEQTMAAAGLGQSIFALIAIFPLGVLLGLDPLASQALGRGDAAATHRHFASARRLAGWMALPAMAGMGLLLLMALQFVTFDPATVDGTWGYLAGRAPCLWPFLLFSAHRSMLQAWSRAGPVASAMVLGNLVNVPASALLAMGDGALTWVGLPEVGLGPGLGATGIGLGTTIVVLAQFLWVRRASNRLPGRPDRPFRRAPVGELWWLGWPIALQFGSEVTIFGGSTILMGVFGETAVAAHQIALNVTSMTFTICLGISSATTVRIGLAVGAADWPRARRSAAVGLAMGVAVMACTATSFVLAAEHIARIFTDVGDVIAAAAGYLGIAAMFQLLDGLQVIGTAGLRGASRTREAMGIGMIGYWAIGLPAMLGLALGADLGPPGVWYGLVAGLAFSGPVAAFRVIRATAGP